MKKVIISLNFADLEVLKLLVKERIAIWNVRLDDAFSVVEREHCLYTMELYENLLTSLSSKKD